MNSKTVYSKIAIFFSWLKEQKLISDTILPKSLSWINLGEATGRHVPSRPAFYILRLKSTKDDPDIVYIGESDNLERRIGFLRSAIRHGTSPHSGGKRLRKKFGSNLSQFDISWL